MQILQSLLCANIVQNIVPEPARLLLQHIITSATVPMTGVTMMAQCSVCTKTYSTIAIYTTYCNLYNRTIQHDQCHNDSESSDCDLVTHVSLSFPLIMGNYALLCILNFHNHNANMCTIVCTLLFDYTNIQNMFTIKLEQLFAVAHC